MSETVDHKISFLINEESVYCFFRYSTKAKRLQLRITRHRIIEVVIPKGINIQKARTFAESNIKWIEKNYSRLKNHQDKFLLFGDEIQIVQTKIDNIKEHTFNFENPSVLKITSPSKSKVSVNKLYEWYVTRYSKIYLPRRLQEIAATHNFYVNRITVRNQATKWGSCSSKKNINLNYKLVKLPGRLIDYIIIHELCHLKEMNHSQKYWREVEKILPNYKSLEKELKYYRL